MQKKAVEVQNNRSLPIFHAGLGRRRTPFSHLSQFRKRRRGRKTCSWWVACRRRRRHSSPLCSIFATPPPPPFTGISSQLQESGRGERETSKIAQRSRMGNSSEEELEEEFPGHEWITPQSSIRAAYQSQTEKVLLSLLPTATTNAISTWLLLSRSMDPTVDYNLVLKSLRHHLAEICKLLLTPHLSLYLSLYGWILFIGSEDALARLHLSTDCILVAAPFPHARTGSLPSLFRLASVVVRRRGMSVLEFCCFGSGAAIMVLLAGRG
jgi:hypothetical protein